MEVSVVAYQQVAEGARGGRDAVGSSRGGPPLAARVLRFREVRAQVLVVGLVDVAPQGVAIVVLVAVVAQTPSVRGDNGRSADQKIPWS